MNILVCEVEEAIGDVVLVDEVVRKENCGDEDENQDGNEYPIAPASGVVGSSDTGHVVTVISSKSCDADEKEYD